jgi:flagellar motor switch protein FliG
MSQDETIDGAAVAALILSRLNTVDQDRLLRAIESTNPTAAAKLEEKIFDFDRIADLRDQKVQSLLQEIPPRDVAISLKVAGDKVREKIFENLPETKQRKIEEDINDLPPMKLADVQAAQRRILKKLDELYPEGTQEGEPADTAKRQKSPWTA